MNDNTNNNDNDINALLEHLRGEAHRQQIPFGNPDPSRWAVALTKLITDYNALAKRVKELESHPPSDRDRELREQLVVAVYPILLAVAWGRSGGSTTAEDMAETLAAMRELAIVEADKMISAMRKGER